MAEVELQFTTKGVRLRSLARLMDIRPGKGAGFEFIPGDPRMDEAFQRLMDSLKKEETPGY